ncbi:MAG TPA: ice-binding family protein [Steroidobacteraceae bacterium]|nr:ice-binding family protein [Steroidobacteraceae bacterium]
MNINEGRPRYRTLIIAAALCVLASGCNRDQIFGNDGIAALVPAVTAETPANGASNVLTTTAFITATFNEPVAPLTGTASFTLTCAAPCVDATGVVSLDAAHTLATFTLTPGTSLAPLTQYTGTIAGAMSLSGGVPMAAPFSWQFTTVATPADVTRPRVLMTSPATSTPGPTLGVPSNSAITATFTKNLAPATVIGANFTVTCTSPCVSPTGTVSYSVGARTAVFTPAANLTTGDTYTATLTTAVTDVAGNALAGNQAALPAASSYIWTFTAAAPSAAGNVSVLSTNPAANAPAVCPTSGVNATFTVPSGLRMDPTTLTPTTFTLTGPAPASTPVTAASVALDPATGHIATFTPQNPLTAGVTYTASIEGGATGVKDLAVPPNTMLANFTWNFTVGPAGSSCAAAVPLGSAATFGTFGGSAGMTNSGILTVVNGNIGTTGVSTKITGFHDSAAGCTYTEVPLANIGTVNGLIYTAPPPPTVACPNEGTAVTAAIAMQASADALIAYNALVARAAGPDPGAGNLANLVLVPGTYTAVAGTFMIEGGDLTLDARGDANAVWVFQMATTLTVGGPGAAFPQSVILVNGAQAKNVYWQVGSAATINAGGGGTMVGTIISQAGAAFSTAGNTAIVTLNGRVLSLNASVTLVDTVINVPAP